MAYLPTSGSSVSADTLTIPKVRELAFLLTGRHRLARLIEARRLGKRESLVVELSELEVGQLPVVPLRQEERFEIIFYPEDEQVPQVLALRDDFPDAPHINRTFLEFPRSLCLYEEPYAEVKLSWTAGRFLDRLRLWIRDTARGALHRVDQPLEPVLLTLTDTLILPFDLAEASPGSADRLTVTQLEETSAGRVLIATRGVDQTKNDGFVGTVVSCEPRVHSLAHVPGNLAELKQLHETAGCDLVTVLRERVLGWSRDEAPLGAHLIVISRFPRTRSEGGPVERTDLWAFLCGSVLDVGVAVGAWEKTGSTIGVILTPVIDPAKLVQSAIAVVNTSVGLSRVRAAETNGQTADSKKISAVGAGALGSQVITQLLRSGFGEWTVLDNDILLPHNVARNELTAHHLGLPKAWALANHAAVVEDAVIQPIVADVLRPGTSQNDVDRALKNAELIADFSASVAVARHLSTYDSPARRLSAFLSPSGQDLVLLVEDEQRQLTLTSLEMQYYRAVLREALLEDHLRPPAGRIQYAHSCRDVTAVVDGAVVRMHSAIATSAIRSRLTSPSAAIAVWRRQATGGVVTSDVVLEPVFQQQAGEWRITWDGALMRAVTQARSSRLPRETGGVLLGFSDMQRKHIFVVDALLSPPDSIEWPTAYIRGADGLAEQVSDASRKTAGMLQYVGEWHSHPEGSSSEASSTDHIALQALAGQMAFDGIPALLLIVGEQGPRWFAL